MKNTIELTKNVIIICKLINTNSNNINKPVVNVNKIISCNNMYNEPLIIEKRRTYTENLNNNSDSNVYIINDSEITIDK